MSDERRIAVCRDYDGLHAALRARVDEMAISCDVIDELAGFSPGYAGKLLGPSQVKALGPVTFGLMLQVLGLAVVVVEDPDTAGKMAGRYKPRDPLKARRGVIRRHYSAEVKEQLAREMAVAWGRAGAAMRNPLRIPLWKRRQLARKAARARWRKARQRERETPPTKQEDKR